MLRKREQDLSKIFFFICYPKEMCSETELDQDQ